MTNHFDTDIKTLYHLNPYKQSLELNAQKELEPKPARSFLSNLYHWLVHLIKKRPYNEKLDQISHRIIGEVQTELDKSRPFSTEEKRTLKKAIKRLKIVIQKNRGSHKTEVKDLLVSIRKIEVAQAVKQLANDGKTDEPIHKPVIKDEIDEANDLSLNDSEDNEDAVTKKTAQKLEEDRDIEVEHSIKTIEASTQTEEEAPNPPLKKADVENQPEKTDPTQDLNKFLGEVSNRFIDLKILDNPALMHLLLDYCSEELKAEILHGILNHNDLSLLKKFVQHENLSDASWDNAWKTYDVKNIKMGALFLLPLKRTAYILENLKECASSSYLTDFFSAYFKNDDIGNHTELLKALSQDLIDHLPLELKEQISFLKLALSEAKPPANFEQMVKNFDEAKSVKLLHLYIPPFSAAKGEVLFKIILFLDKIGSITPLLICCYSCLCNISIHIKKDLEKNLPIHLQNLRMRIRMEFVEKEIQEFFLEQIKLSFTQENIIEIPEVKTAFKYLMTALKDKDYLKKPILPFLVKLYRDNAGDNSFKALCPRIHQVVSEYVEFMFVNEIKPNIPSEDEGNNCRPTSNRLIMGLLKIILDNNKDKKVRLAAKSLLENHMNSFVKSMYKRIVSENEYEKVIEGLEEMPEAARNYSWLS